ncbi:MAG: RnfABCDGE type electron transport complex subunit G [Gammaproteobacteria bacterium]
MKRYQAVVILCVAACVSIYATHWLTRDSIRAGREQRQLALLNTVITQQYDNNPLHDYTTVTTTRSGTEHTVYIYHTRKDGELNGLVARPIVADGYSSTIKLMLGMTSDGSITGVRVLQHNETENLGALIDQDNSDWLQVFNHLSLQNTPATEWGDKREGGRIDGISGATVTSRAVINAIRQWLEYYTKNYAKNHTKNYANDE